MKTCLMLLCLLASALSASVRNKPHAKDQNSSKLLQTLQMTDDPQAQTPSDQDLLPTSITFEASSLEQEDEDVSYSPERGGDEGGTPVLLSEAVLARLLGAKEEATEEETSTGHLIPTNMDYAVDSDGDGNGESDRDSSGSNTSEPKDDAQDSDLIPEMVDYDPQEEADISSERFEDGVGQIRLVSRDPTEGRVRKDPRPVDRRPEGPVEQEAAEDPCEGFPCKRGKTCRVNEENQPECVCQDPISCAPSMTEFQHVCGTDNKTYDSACQLFATKCGLEGSKQGRRLHLDYTGPCKLITPCQDGELQQFPLRMRDWLKNVLLQRYELDSKAPGLLTLKQRLRVQKIYESERRLHAGDHPIETLARDFEKNYHMYIYPVHWQFAQMDQHPADRYLTHSELAPLRAPLVPMEHCTSRFFQECDGDKDNHVSFREWGQCFGIKKDDMDVNLLF
ncbi:SPARC-like protein 1 [Scleropages formosus]|nr:SPARC-like [Scleropages formosus]XP_029114938.1 SPARC-like [Scleropages formosus]